MSSDQVLRDHLRRIDGRGYGAYKDLRGSYRFPRFTLFIDHVQGDPFAAPSRVRVQLPQEIAGFPEDTYSTPCRAVALRDWLARGFAASCTQRPLGDATRGGSRGSGKSGLISMPRPGQEILERSSVLVDKRRVEARFTMGLPAFGRRIAGRQAEQMFFQQLPRMVEQSLEFANSDSAALYRHIFAAEDAEALRAACRSRGWVAFIADGSVLPRASGVDPRPLHGSKVVAFRSPPELRRTVKLPHRGEVSGMAVPRGVTLVVGGGYHGKSTLLQAIEAGVYNHIPGDGRELVVADAGAVKIRAEDGRRVAGVDISWFIDKLPQGKDTRSFSSEDASGSTSQAANIVEALEAGATTLLMDEDTSATNFMIRDHRMQALVVRDNEPITPFIDRVRQLFQEHGVSTILVLGGSGDYLDVADLVIGMNSYLPADLTARAREVASRFPTQRVREGSDRLGTVRERRPVAASVSARKGRREVKVTARGVHAIQFGTELIDLSAVEQIVDPGQTSALGDALVLARRYMDGRSVREVIQAIDQQVSREGLDCLAFGAGGSVVRGEYVRFRHLELAQVMNRLRSLEVRPI